MQIGVAFIAKERDGCIQVIDLSPMLPPIKRQGITTVTDAPEVVVHELAKRGFPVNDRPIIYLDEDNIWDVIKVHNFHFDNFMVLHARTWERALGALLSGGVITKNDLKRPPVVDKDFTI